MKRNYDMARGCMNRVDVAAFRDAIGLRAVAIPDEKRLFVNCGKCENCLRDRAKDWVGRTIGEAFGADRSYMVTLTIGGRDWYRSLELEDNPRAQKFHKEDVRLYVKRLRYFQSIDWKARLLRQGLDWRKYMPPSMRFFYVGENGDEKGRVHYHMLAYYYGSEGPRVPDGEDVFHGLMDRSVYGPYELVEDGDRTYWPWGWSNWKKAEPFHSWYLSNYVNKGALIGRQGASIMRPGISTRPMLGARYFDALASDHVTQGLPLQGRKYRAPKNPYYSGPVAEYWMSEAAARRFCESYMRGWEAKYGGQDWPQSELVERHLDRKAARECGTVASEIEDDLFRVRLANRTLLRGFQRDWSGFVSARGDVEPLLMSVAEYQDRHRRLLRDSEKVLWGF